MGWVFLKGSVLSGLGCDYWRKKSGVEAETLGNEGKQNFFVFFSGFGLVGD